MTNDWVDNFCIWIEGDHWTARTCRYLTTGLACTALVVGCCMIYMLTGKDYYKALKGDINER